MPVIQVSLIEGYDDATKTRLCQRLSAAARTVIAAKPEATTVMVQDIPGAGYLRGTGPATPAPAALDPERVARQFLTALEARDLPAASAHLAPEAQMVFPGGATFTQLTALVDWARPRYRFVRKRIDHMDTTSGERGPIVYCFGTLFGEWPDGAPFDGIRFIDRFEIIDGLIHRQDVWNDMGEAQRPTGS